MTRHNYYKPQSTPHFVGRAYELTRLREIHTRDEASIIVVYGRRRVGKTELIEHFFKDDPLFKFEGLQIEPPKRGAYQKMAQLQIEECVRRLGMYLRKEREYARISCKNWTEFFELLSPVVERERIVLYLEEVQWLAAYQGDLLARLKPFWDDRWRHNKKLRIVLSGSSPSFLISQFLADKALYNRSTETIFLKPFSHEEISEYLDRLGPREKLQAALCIGGIPEYLKQIKNEPSVLLGLSKKSFRPSSFFIEEYNKIFVSSFSQNAHYRKVIRLLSENRFLTREELLAMTVGETASGGTFSAVLRDLELCGFIAQYSSVHLKKGTKLARYCIADEYLNFFHRFIEPIRKKIEKGTYAESYERVISKRDFSVVLGLSFERWAWKNERLFAKLLGFDKIEYDAGPFFNRALNKEYPGFQIDLLYVRKDSKLIVAEAKYYDGFVPSEVKREVDRKIDLLLSHHPKYKNYTCETLLITTEGRKDSSRHKEWFDHVITLEDLFDSGR